MNKITLVPQDTQNSKSNSSPAACELFELAPNTLKELCALANYVPSIYCSPHDKLSIINIDELRSEISELLYVASENLEIVDEITRQLNRATKNISHLKKASDTANERPDDYLRVLSEELSKSYYRITNNMEAVKNRLFNIITHEINLQNPGRDFLESRVIKVGEQIAKQNALVDRSFDIFAVGQWISSLVGKDWLSLPKEDPELLRTKIHLIQPKRRSASAAKPKRRLSASPSL